MKAPKRTENFLDKEGNFNPVKNIIELLCNNRKAYIDLIKLELEAFRKEDLSFMSREEIHDRINRFKRNILILKTFNKYDYYYSPGVFCQVLPESTRTELLKMGRELYPRFSLYNFVKFSIENKSV